MRIPENLQNIYVDAHRKVKSAVLERVASECGIVEETARLKINRKIRVTDDEYVVIKKVLTALPLSSQAAKQPIAHAQPA